MVVGKTTGLLATSAVYGLASTLGTAGTGTAIGTLSGAAANSATMALIGKLVGGGMAAGALLLPAIGIFAGLLAVRALSRKTTESPRQPKDLNPTETAIVFCAISLLRPLEAMSDSDVLDLSAEELSIFVRDGVRPLLDRIEEYSPETEISQNGITKSPINSLTAKFQTQLRGYSHQLRSAIHQVPHPKCEFKPVETVGWIGRLWRAAVGRSSKTKVETSLSSAVLALAFRSLLEEDSGEIRDEQHMVFDALRRVDERLSKASPELLAERVRKLNRDELENIVAETKRNYLKHILKKGLKPKSAEKLDALVREACADGCDVEFVLNHKSLKSVAIRKSVASATISEHLARHQNSAIQLSDKMIVVLEALANPKLQSAVFNQTFFERVRQHQQDGALSEVTDSLLESSSIHAGVIVFICLNAPEEAKRNQRELIEYGVISVVANAALDTAAEYSGLSIS